MVDCFDEYDPDDERYEDSCDEVVYYEGWHAADSDLSMNEFTTCPYGDEDEYNLRIWYDGYFDRVTN